MQVGQIAFGYAGNPPTSPLDGLKARWPKSDLDYLRALATTILALLVLPLVVVHFFLHPFAVAEHAIKERV